MKNTILSIIAVIAVTATSFAAIPSVLTGPVLNPANNHNDYLLDTENWTSTQSKALSMGGHLVTINDAAECF